MGIDGEHLVIVRSPSHTGSLTRIFHGLGFEQQIGGLPPIVLPILRFRVIRSIRDLSTSSSVICRPPKSSEWRIAVKAIVAAEAAPQSAESVHHADCRSRPELRRASCVFLCDWIPTS